MNARLHDLAALYAAGMLAPDEIPLFEQHLAECGACQTEVREIQELTADLAILGATDPPPSLRQRVIDQAHETAPRPGFIFDRAGVFLARSGEIPWREVLPGVEVKRLFFDKERRYNTSLVRIAAGGHYPSHRHKECEEIFVLSGEIMIEGTLARAGDYCRAQAESIHKDSHSPGGCLFLVVASARDELLA